MHPCRFISVAKLPLWWGMVIKGEKAMWEWRQEVYGKSLLSAQFLSEPKTALKNKVWEFLLWLSGSGTSLVSTECGCGSLALLSGLRILCCHKLWHRSQTRLGSGIATALAKARSCSSNSTPSLGTFVCHRCSLKKPNKNKETIEWILIQYFF